MDAGARSKESSLKGDLKLLRNATDIFHNDTGAWPTALVDLVSPTAPAAGKDNASTAKPIIATDWKGPYLQTVPMDPISNIAFTYNVTAGFVGGVTSSATGNGLDGTSYISW
jgi:hypothetical protein